MPPSIKENDTMAEGDARFDEAALMAAAREREIELTTWGRKSGAAERVTLWISTDGRRIFIRSGGGMGRDWPRNLLATGRGILHLAGRDLAGRDLPVRARHVTDPGEARAVSALVGAKYGTPYQAPAEGQPLTPAETATFELTPDVA